MWRIPKFSFLLFLLTIYSAGFSQNMTGADEFRRFWELREKSFRNPASTPLLPKDLAGFKGFSCFAFDETYRVTALLVKDRETKSFLMPTSTGGMRKYLKIGDLNFKLNGRDFSLGAYLYEYAADHPKAAEEDRDLFIPFRDLTNIDETYRAGRYVYVRFPRNGEAVVLDFNVSYNPNCAYGNLNFSCTLPPKENSLPVEIKAGEKKFLRKQ